MILYMELNDLISKIHEDCFKLCKDKLGTYLPVAGNIGIFCQSDADYAKYSKIKEDLTYPSSNPDQKYFELKTPIMIDQIGDIPETIYTHLYIRKPNKDSPEAGDVDFVLQEKDYSKMKERVMQGKYGEGVSIYDRPGWDNIEIKSPEINAIAYVSTLEMAQKVRVKF